MERARGFSLIELLVVIAVITTLATLLLPVLVASRAAGRTAACQSNLRQLGMAMESYRAENNEYIPARLPNYTPLMPARSDRGFLDGLGVFGGTALALDELFNVHGLDPFIEDIRILHCPGTAHLTELSYGVNGRVMDVITSYKKIRDASQTPMSFDSRRTVSYYYSDLDFRHKHDSNVLYADGHVEPKYLDVMFRYDGAVPLPGPFARKGGLADDTSSLVGGTFTLRVAGSKWDIVHFLLQEDGYEFARTFIDRQPGNPDEQTVTLGPFFLDPVHRTYIIDMTMETQFAGGNPVWLIVNDGHQTQIATLNKNHFHEVVDITRILREALGL